MRKVYLVLFALGTFLIAVQSSKAQESYTAQVYYYDGGSDMVYDFLFEGVRGMLLYQGDTEYMISFSDMRVIEFLGGESFTDPDGELGYRDSVRVTFRNGYVDIYDAYSYDLEYYTGTTDSGSWWVYTEDVIRIEFY